MKLEGHPLGMSLGIVWGGVIFLATVTLLVKAGLDIHYEEYMGVGPTLEKIGQFYIGYSVSWFGSIVGFIYGFITGYVGGWVISILYNKYAGNFD